jgi:hypothetical protein
MSFVLKDTTGGQPWNIFSNAGRLVKATHCQGSPFIVFPIDDHPSPARRTSISAVYL